MAGLGEACSHIAALLFLLEANTQYKKNISCTSRLFYWLPPSFKRSVPFARIADINFTSPQTKRKRLAEHELPQTQTTSSPSSSTVLPPSSSTVLSSSSSAILPSTSSTRLSTSSHQPTDSELDAFYQALSKAGKPAVLAVVPKYCDAYIPLRRQGIASLPKPLTDLYKEEYMLLSHVDLLQQCQDTFHQLSITSYRSVELEKQTRDQAKSKLWFAHRAARITSSKFKDAVRTRLSHPSQSLIKSICYPESTRFTSKATEWGSSHEAHALEIYKLNERDRHDCFSISSSGLVVNSNWPHFGASPDAIVTCTCCGKGVVEIKCPYTCVDKALIEAASSNSNSFCLEVVDGQLQLKRDHTYYYQVQLQIKLCDVKYAEFVVWRPGETHIERVTIDDELLTDALDRATQFYINGVLPEVLGKWYSRLPDYTSHQDTDKTTAHQPSLSTTLELQDEDAWCYCREGEGEMIACDSGHCLIGWFHTACLKITKIPDGNWVCPDCSL